MESPSFSDIVQDAEGRLTKARYNIHVTDVAAFFSDSSYVVSEKIAKLRKGRFSEHYLRGLNQVSELKEKLEVLNESQKRRKMLLTALKARALLSSHDPLRKAELNVSIEKLTKSYCRYERKLYRMKAERAVVQAKVDYFLLKLSPKLKYTDIYAKTDSSYLSPIPEESEDELEDLQ